MAGQKSFMDAMVIDCDKVSNVIVDFIRKKVEEEKKNGIVLGLSGGVDSAVSAILAAKAVDPSKVYGLHLFDRDSQKKFREYAQRIADRLGINFEIRNITQLVKEKGAYKSPIMKISPFSSALNRLLFLLFRFTCHLIFRETNFSLDLKEGAPAKSKVTKILYNLLAKGPGESFNVRHIQRRKILEGYAVKHNLLLIGAANKSESFVGWFVKDGVDDLLIEPLLGLYKSQVRQLAFHLGIPKEIMSETPSPDMCKGLTDELIIGYAYEKIDKVAYVLEHSLSEEIVFTEGITPKEFEDIKNLNQLSAWKRENKHEFPVL